MATSKSIANILVVDDDEGHCELVRRNLRRGGIRNQVVALADGGLALDYILCRGPYVDRSRDDDLLVLLDINMPGIDGIEVLRQIKLDPRARWLPVLMLTTAENVREMDRCFEYGCNMYLTKSVELVQFVKAVRRVADSARLVTASVRGGRGLVNKSVLIVEDDQATAELERRALTRAGTDAVVVSQIGHALALLEEQAFCAIILDYHMPDGDSWTVVAAAEAKSPPIPVIMLTGQGSELVASRAMERGVAHYLKKSGTCWDEIPRIVARVTDRAAKAEGLRASEAQLRLRANDAEAANKAKSDFLASMSHEIRTPLSAVLGFGHLLEQSQLTEHQRQYLGKIQFASNALLGVVNQVLDLSKIEAGEMSFENLPLDLPELLSNVIGMLTLQAAAKGLELRVLPLADLQCTVCGDGARLAQILVNLINNAIKFTDAGHVAVNMLFTAQDAGHLSMRCEVQDTGIGIESGALQRLFQPFTQADPTIARRFGGTGLGLSISHRLVRLMGGTMGVSSTVGVGSTFWFEIPLARQVSQPSEPGAAAEGQQSRLNGIRALVVDDSDVNLEIVRRMLERQGATVTCCSNGASAVEHVRARPRRWDVVLMDVQMPVLDGNEATRCIRHDPALRTLPVIGLTAGVLPSDRQRSLDAGMNGLLVKPFDTAALVREVQLLVRAESPLRVARS